MADKFAEADVTPWDTLTPLAMKDVSKQGVLCLAPPVVPVPRLAEELSFSGAVHLQSSSEIAADSWERSNLV